MNRLLLTVLLASQACVTEPQDEFNPFEGPEALVDIQVGPPGLTLAGPGWLVPGYPATFTVTGPLTTGEQVFFGLGLGGVGAGPCPGALGGQCLDIRAPIRLIGSASESGGEATLTVTVPATAPVGRTVGLQTAAVRGLGGASSLLSNSIPLPVRAAVLGCIDPAATDYDPAATVDDGSCTYAGGAYVRYTWAQAGVVNNGRANAELYCASIGGQLARPNSQAQWDALHADIPQDSNGWWIDGHNNFTCGSATPGSPKTYQYGLMYSPSGTPNMYTGCNCNPSEQGLVAYRYNGGGPFDGCEGVDTAVGNLGVMDEELTYNHPNIVGFICELPGVSPIVEMVAGDIPYPTSCVAGDFECQAEQVCEGVTGTDCIRQDYECAYGYMGSYYPVGTPGSSTFNFAITYDFQFGDYGNICCGDPNYCTTYGIRMDHTGAGYGHWGLVY